MQYKIDYVVKDAREGVYNKVVNINAEQDIEVLVNCKIFLEEMSKKNNEYPIYFYTIKKITKDGDVFLENEDLEKKLKEFDLPCEINKNERQNIVNIFLGSVPAKVGPYCER